MNAEKLLADSMETEYQIKDVVILGHKINYLEAGSGEPVVLIHGGNIGWGQWYPNIPVLSKRYKIYAIDLPGGGRSSVIDFENFDPVRDFVEVAERFIKLNNLNKVNLVGSSIGGWVCLMLALRGNVSIAKIILADSLGFTTKAKLSDKIIGIKWIARLLVKTVLKPVRTNKNIERFITGVFHNKKFPLSRNFVEYFYETMSRSHNLLLISQIAGPSGVNPKFILLNDLDKIKNKVLIIWGKQDQLMRFDDYKKLFSKIPSVEIKVIDNAGHIPSIEASGEFNECVSRFFEVG